MLTILDDPACLTIYLGLQLASERWQEYLPGALDAGRRCADAQQVVRVSFISCSVISCKPVHVSTQVSAARNE